MQAEQSAWSTRSYDKVSVLSVFKFHPEEVALIKERGAVLLKFLDIFNLIYCCSLFTVLNFSMGKKKKKKRINRLRPTHDILLQLNSLELYWLLTRSLACLDVLLEEFSKTRLIRSRVFFVWGSEEFWWLYKSNVKWDLLIQ